MKANQNQMNKVLEIKSIEDVVVFADVLRLEGCSFHPDDDFSEYVNKDNEPAYNSEEIELRNRLMDECFAVCKSENKDVYEVMSNPAI